MPKIYIHTLSKGLFMFELEDPVAWLDNLCEEVDLEDGFITIKTKVGWTWIPAKNIDYIEIKL